MNEADTRANLIEPKLKAAGWAGQWEEPGSHWVPGSAVQSACVEFQPGYVLYAKLRPYLNKVVVCSREGIASTEFVPLLPKVGLLTPEFLAWFLRSPWFVGYAGHNTTGSRMPRLRMDALWDAQFPLPPLDEQRRIVAKVEQVIERVREAKRLHAEARQGADLLISRILAEVFPSPGSVLPQGWYWVKLAEVAETPQYGYTHAGITEPVGPKLLRISDIQNGSVDWEQVPYC